MSTLKEIRISLKKKGAKKEDIDAAIRLFRYLETTDSLVFPERPVAINFSVKKNKFGSPVGCSSDRKTEARHIIFVDGLTCWLRETKNQRGLWIPNLKGKGGSRLLEPTWEELLVGMAAHEVRHRVQRDCSCKRFSPKRGRPIKDNLLRAIVFFVDYVFKYSEKKWTETGGLKAYIKDRINQKEFDACVIERLVAVTIHRKSAYNLRGEIASIIKMSAP